MALIDITRPKRTVTDEANNVREKIADIIFLADIRLQEIRNLIRIHTRAAIATELGSDAADMLTVYTQLKAAIETAKKITVEELP